MHIALVMNSASGVKTRRADLIRFLQSNGHTVTVVSAIDNTADDPRSMGVTFVHWPVSRHGLNPFVESLSLLALRKILSTLQPHIILCFTQKAVLYGSLAARSIPHSSVFSVFAGLGYLFSEDSALLKPLRPLIYLIFKYALKNNRLVFFQNPDDLNLFVTRRIVPLDRTCRLYGSGVDTKRFVPVESQSKRRRETVFLMISRLVASKGVLDYIEAAKILKHDHCRAHFRILGPFDDHPTAVDRDTIQSAVDSGTIEYCGTTTDVRPYLQDADVFVLPSYREGTPRSSLEALAMAKPILTTDSPGCRETVIHDSNGYLVPVRNAVALSEAMRKLVGARDQIRAMGARSRKLAEELYDVDKVNAVLWREIGRALKSMTQRTPRKGA